MSFIVTAPAPEIAEASINAGDFWPAIDIAKVRDAMRVDSTITPERLRNALINAIAQVNQELDLWRIARELDGFHKLADVPAPQVDNLSVHTHRYIRAVGSLAKAFVTETHRDVDATAAGEKKSEVLDPTIADLRRDARWAISDILGIPRTTVELI